jgi:PleD family two-component response regulator
MKPIKQADLFNALTRALGKVTTVTNSLRQKKIFDPAMAARLPLKILVAEDNIVNQKVAVAILLQFGYQTDLVISGKDARKQWNAKSMISSLWTSKCRRWMVSKLPASFAHA